MKTLSLILGIAWTGLAVCFGLGFTEPSQFVYTGMAVIIAVDEFMNYFRNR